MIEEFLYKLKLYRLHIFQNEVLCKWYVHLLRVGGFGWPWTIFSQFEWIPARWRRSSYLKHFYKNMNINVLYEYSLMKWKTNVSRMWLYFILYLLIYCISQVIPYNAHDVYMTKFSRNRKNLHLVRIYLEHLRNGTKRTHRNYSWKIAARSSYQKYSHVHKASSALFSKFSYYQITFLSKLTLRYIWRRGGKNN